MSISVVWYYGVAATLALRWKMWRTKASIEHLATSRENTKLHSRSRASRLRSRVEQTNPALDTEPTPFTLRTEPTPLTPRAEPPLTCGADLTILTRGREQVVGTSAHGLTECQSLRRRGWTTAKL